MTKETIKKCKCGSIDFIVNERISHRAILIENRLDVHKNYANEIESITCSKCDKNYTEDLTLILDFCE